MSSSISSFDAANVVSGSLEVYGPFLGRVRFAADLVKKGIRHLVNVLRTDPRGSQLIDIT